MDDGEGGPESEEAFSVRVWGGRGRQPPPTRTKSNAARRGEEDESKTLVFLDDINEKGNWTRRQQQQ